MSIGPGGDILAVVEPSAIRRWLGIAMHVTLGVLLIWVASQSAGAPVWTAVFLVAGIAALWLAERMRRGTRSRIELTREVLRTADGTELARVGNVRVVERGAFAFKPANGFLVRLKTPVKAGWAPGLWWRRGTFLGIGGVVSAGQSKAMAEILTALTLDLLPPDDDAAS